MKFSAKISVPNFINKYYYEVELFAKSQKLKLGAISYIDYPSLKEFTVISQYPPPNSMASPDTPIDLLISEPKLTKSYIMPNFISKNYDFVLSEMASLGFKIEKPREIKLPHYESGIILSQSPLPGTKINKKTTIIFTINGGL